MSIFQTQKRKDLFTENCFVFSKVESNSTLKFFQKTTDWVLCKGNLFKCEIAAADKLNEQVFG